MEKKLMAPILITAKQREWLEREQERTGNTFAVIVRGLIQEQVTKTSNKS